MKRICVLILLVATLPSTSLAKSYAIYGRIRQAECSLRDYCQISPGQRDVEVISFYLAHVPGYSDIIISDIYVKTRGLPADTPLRLYYGGIFVSESKKGRVIRGFKVMRPIALWDEWLFAFDGFSLTQSHRRRYVPYTIMADIPNEVSPTVEIKVESYQAFAASIQPDKKIGTLRGLLNLRGRQLQVASK